MTEEEVLAWVKDNVCCKKPLTVYCPNAICPETNGQGCPWCIIIDALEMQISRKVRFDGANAYCPRCDNNLTLSHGCEVCDQCGQWLDWEEDSTS